jgi:hypothetical protein
MFAAANIAGARSRTFSATDLAMMNCGPGRCAQLCGITQRPRFVVREVGFLVRDTCAADKAIGSRGPPGQCLARTLC